MQEFIKVKSKVRKNIRHFLIYGNFNPALTPSREKLFVRGRVADVVIGLAGGIAMVIAAFTSKDGNYLPVFFVFVAVSLLFTAYRILSGQTYYQLLRKDVKDGRHEAQEILKSVGVQHGKK